MRILVWLLAALLVFAGLALLPMRDLRVTVAMAAAAAHTVSLPWLLTAFRVVGAGCLLSGIVLGWRMLSRSSGPERPPK